jgi:apolipoprotein N-acyltransferase
MTEEINAEEMQEQVVTPEQALRMYEQKLQEQTAIIFGLIAKMGGKVTKVTLTASDFENGGEFNTVLANNNESGDVILELAFEKHD